MDLALALAARRAAPTSSRQRPRRRPVRGRRARTGRRRGGCCAATRSACCSPTALLRHGVRGTYATTIVSSSMLRRDGARSRRRLRRDAHRLQVDRPAPRRICAFGYEEALATASRRTLVRDKDGISAALLVAELAAELKAERGSSLTAPARRAGRRSTAVTPPTRSRSAWTTWRSSPRRWLGCGPRRRRPCSASRCGSIDLLPDADVVAAVTGPAAGSWSVRRGTEPKLKAYLEVVVPDGSAEDAANHLARLRAEVDAALELVSPLRSYRGPNCRSPASPSPGTM